MPLTDLFSDYTLRTVALGALALGATSGALGTFAVLRRQSLLGDAISHAALPGIVLAFLLTGTKSTLVLVLGAAFAGWIGTLIVMAVVRSTRVPEDSALGIVLSAPEHPDASTTTNADALRRRLHGFGEIGSRILEVPRSDDPQSAASALAPALAWIG